MASDSSRKLRLPVIFHGAWAIPGLVATYVFATATGGHPPGLVFLPLVLLAWAAGHFVIWGGTRLVRRGAERRGVGSRVPASIVVSIVLTGAMAIAGILLVVSSLIGGRVGWSGVEGTLLIAVWVSHSAACVGLLLRTAWGRILAAAAAIGWAGVVVWQVADHLIHERPVDPVEMAVTVVVVALLGVLAYRLLVGRTERLHTAALRSVDDGSSTDPPGKDS